MFSIQFGADTSIVFQRQPTLLAALEEHGIELNSECRSGECGECKVKLRKGKVKQLVNVEMDLQPGEVLPCCCVPESDLRLEV